MASVGTSTGFNEQAQVSFKKVPESELLKPKLRNMKKKRGRRLSYINKIWLLDQTKPNQTEPRSFQL
jgi:hypothetical protein